MLRCLEILVWIGGFAVFRWWLCVVRVLFATVFQAALCSTRLASGIGIFRFTRLAVSAFSIRRVVRGLISLGRTGLRSLIRVSVVRLRT